MAHQFDRNAWRRTLDPRDPENLDPLTEEQEKELEEAQQAQWELDADFERF